MTEEEFRSLVIGRTIADVRFYFSTEVFAIERITLDDGTELQLWGYGGMACFHIDEGNTVEESDEIQWA